MICLAWAEVIRGWMERQGLESAGITQLQEGSGLSMVKIWLAALLCGAWAEAMRGCNREWCCFIDRIWLAALLCGLGMAGGAFYVAITVE